MHMYMCVYDSLHIHYKKKMCLPFSYIETYILGDRIGCDLLSISGIKRYDITINEKLENSPVKQK